MIYLIFFLLFSSFIFQLCIYFPFSALYYNYTNTLKTILLLMLNFDRFVKRHSVSRSAYKINNRETACIKNISCRFAALITDILCVCISWKHVEDYIDQQFEQYFRDESGLNRKNIQDNRVHCLLYFISPFGHGYIPTSASKDVLQPQLHPCSMFRV